MEDWVFAKDNLFMLLFVSEMWNKILSYHGMI